MGRFGGSGRREKLWCLAVRAGTRQGGRPPQASRLCSAGSHPEKSRSHSALTLGGRLREASPAAPGLAASPGKSPLEQMLRAWEAEEQAPELRGEGTALCVAAALPSPGP